MSEVLYKDFSLRVHYIDVGGEAMTDTALMEAVLEMLDDAVYGDIEGRIVGFGIEPKEEI